MSKNLSTHPKGTWTRRADALGMTGQLTRDRSDAERHKKVHKRMPGALRVCSVCQAVSAEKRWLTEPDAIGRRLAQHQGELEATLCPGCARVRDRRVDGWIRLQGGSVRDREEEFRNMVYHILDDARRDDPVHRIVSWQVDGDRITIETTSQWLAETIGKAVKREFHGRLDLRFIPDEEFVRVYWRP